MKENVIKAVEDNKIIAILRAVPGDKLIPVAEALYSGGIRLLEIPYNANDRSLDHVVAKNIEALIEHFDNQLYVGAGTVLTKEQVHLTKVAGATFIISPNTDQAVIQEGCNCDLVTIPGGFTPTEVVTAYRFGADFVKLFPITSMGPDYIKAIKAPLSHIKLLAVGGVDENNICDYLRAGVCGFGLGSNIVKKELLVNNDYAGIAALARKYVEAINYG